MRVHLVGCLTANCSTKSCPCLQEITSNVGQCTCFPSASCISDSEKFALKPAISSISAVINGLIIYMMKNLYCLYFQIGSCQSQPNPCSSNGLCLQVSSSQFLCQCKTDFTGILCQTALYSPNIDIFNTCQCVNGGVCSMNGTCICPNRYRGIFCQLGLFLIQKILSY